MFTTPVSSKKDISFDKIKEIDQTPRAFRVTLCALGIILIVMASLALAKVGVMSSLGLPGGILTMVVGNLLICCKGRCFKPDSEAKENSEESVNAATAPMTPALQSSQTYFATPSSQTQAKGPSNTTTPTEAPSQTASVHASPQIATPEFDELLTHFKTAFQANERIKMRIQGYIHSVLREAPYEYTETQSYEKCLEVLDNVKVYWMVARQQKDFSCDLTISFFSANNLKNNFGRKIKY